MSARTAIPAWVITGPLGSGKTTLIARWLAAKPDHENWVVLLNEFTDAGIDALTVAAAARGAFDVRLIPGGCLCCAGEADFRRSLQELIANVRPAAILIEPSGIGHPGGIVDELLAHEARGDLELRGVIGLIDPAHAGSDDETVVAIREIADVLLLSKADLATDAQRQQFADDAAAIFPPKAWVGESHRGELPEAVLALPGSAGSRRASAKAFERPAAHRHQGHGDVVGESRAEVGERREFHQLGRHGARWSFPRALEFSESALLSLLGGDLARSDPRLANPERFKAVLRIGEDAWVLAQRVGGRLSLQPTAWRRDNRIEVQLPPGASWEASAWDQLWLRCLAPRPALMRWYAAGLTAVRAEPVFRQHAEVTAGVWRFRRRGEEILCHLPDRAAGGRLRLIALGKAARAMADGFAASLVGSGITIDDGIIITKERSATPSPWLEIEGDHPYAGERSESAAHTLLDFIGQPTAADRFVVLISGGASALCALPRAGVTLAEKTAVIRALIDGGASIVEINRRRCELSAIKGGGLARRLAPAATITLAISDVPGDDLALIGSGPSFDPPRAPGMVIATLDDALEAIETTARAEGIEVRSLGRTLYGDVQQEAARVATIIAAAERAVRPRLWIAGGEPVVTVRGHGRGGRAQELALRLAKDLATRAPELRFHALVAGTDGSDGPTDAAGGFADAATLQRVSATGIDLDAALADNDAYAVLGAVGDRFITGPTGTNVADVVLVLESSG